MVWKAICFNDQTSLCFISGRQKSENYQKKFALLSVDEILSEGDCIFEHENAVITAIAQRHTGLDPTVFEFVRPLVIF